MDSLFSVPADHLVPAKALGDVAAISVTDLGQAVISLTRKPRNTDVLNVGGQLDLGGSEIRNIAQ